MKFWNPDFEIPDRWLDVTGMATFRPKMGLTYEPLMDADQLRRFPERQPRTYLLQHIKPPRRNEGVRWFEEDRMLSVLAGIVHDDPMPPIEIQPEERPFRVYNGFHRYYASIIAGFKYIPAIAFPEFESAETGSE